MHEKYGINTVEDMKKHWELFRDPEDPAKGAFINCIIGWQCTEINRAKFEAYGLDQYYNLIHPGSAAALDAALAGAQDRGEPVFGYYRAPTGLMGQYSWYVLEEPEYTAECWDEVMKGREPELPISSCLGPSNAPSSTRAIVVSRTDAVNHPIKLTKPSVGVVS